MNQTPDARFDPVEFGDFQTPLWLARQVVFRLAREGRYRAVLEPTCGVGNFLMAALEGLEGLEAAWGVDINPRHLAAARAQSWPGLTPTLRQADVFTTDLTDLTRDLPTPYLVLGNPPWITNATQGLREGQNLPRKSNLKGLSGYDALTGKANFDVSEWLLLHILGRVSGTANACAMIVKTSVLRKVILHARKIDARVGDFRAYAIDAKQAFGVSVHACVFCFRGLERAEQAQHGYRWFSSLESEQSTLYTLEGDHFVEDLARFAQTQRYATPGQRRWRSGIKHDLARVMELRRDGEHLVNGAGEVLDLEPDLVFPLWKSSDVAGEATRNRLFTVVTQRRIGEDTARIALEQPETWAYLCRHREHFEGRKSSIYAGKPQFSIFGVGDYSFAPYKVAISGLYKRLTFTLLEPLEGKCAMVDDTCYFLGFEDRNTALLYLTALQHPKAKQFFESRIAWTDKRPIKKDILDDFNLELFLMDHREEILATLLSHAGLSASDLEAQLSRLLPERPSSQPVLLETRS